MSSFKNYSRKDLNPADRKALAAALTTMYMEGMGSFPPNQNWDDHWWNSYSIGYIPNVRSFITINASQGESDQPERFHMFSVNTNRQAVTWKVGKHAHNAIPVPEHLRPFLSQLTVTVHDIAAKRTEALELQRKREEEAREEAKKYYEANKEKIDAERELKRKRMEEEAAEAQAKRAERELKKKLFCRKTELDHALRVMNWKASLAMHPTSPADEKKPTEVDKMLESAKRGPKHDFCEECGERLRFCGGEGCNIVGCHNCFEDELTVCTSCAGVFCEKHDALNTCSKCEERVCQPCHGQTCPSCEEFVCNDCSECGCGTSLNEDTYLYDDAYDSDYDQENLFF